MAQTSNVFQVPLAGHQRDTHHNRFSSMQLVGANTTESRFATQPLLDGEKESVNAKVRIIVEPYGRVRWDCQQHAVVCA